MLRLEKSTRSLRNEFVVRKLLELATFFLFEIGGLVREFCACGGTHYTRESRVPTRTYLNVGPWPLSPLMTSALRLMSYLLLASRSPRRRQLLEEVGFTVRVEAADIEEHSVEADPVAIAMDLAKQKGAATVARFPALAKEALFTLAADTVVWTDDGQVLGKPVDREDARRTLSRLLGTTHQVTTGFAIFGADATPIALGEQTAAVTMSSLSASALEAYIDTDEPWDKAGAYGVQGLAGAFVSRIEGSWHTVVGLPVHEVLRVALSNGLLVHMPWESLR